MTNDDDLAAHYLRRLRRAARVLPRATRRELISQISDHIAESRAAVSAGVAGSPTLPETLDMLGDPRHIVAEAAAPALTDRAGKRETAAVFMLLLGPFAGLVAVRAAGFGGAEAVGMLAGWVVGLMLLGASPRWCWRDKLLGALVWPGGLAVPFFLATLPGQTCMSSGNGPQTCSGFALPLWLGIPTLIASVLGPILVAVWLLHQARRAADPGDQSLTSVPAG